MKQLLLILCLLTSIGATAQTTDTLALDSIAIDLPIKVGLLQYGYDIISDVGVKSAIAVAVDTVSDTSQTVTVHINAAQLVRLYEPVAGMSQGLVRRWTDAIKPLLYTYLIVPENYYLRVELGRIEGSYDTQIEYRRLGAIPRMAEHLKSIKANQ